MSKPEAPVIGPQNSDIDRMLLIVPADLRAAFPDMKGLHGANLKYMRFFAQEFRVRQFSQQIADQSQTLGQRVKQLAERYETPLPTLADNVVKLSAKVAAHLKKMGFEP